MKKVVQPSKGGEILLTRPLADAQIIERRLREYGVYEYGAHECGVREYGDKVLCAPIMTIDPRPIDEDIPDDTQALIITSANGVRAFAAVVSRRDLAVFAVGRFSAAAARQLGFSQVNSADGAVDDLCDLIIARLKPEDGALVHPAGSHTRSRLTQRLKEAGFSIHRLVCYHASIVRKLPVVIAQVLRRQSVRAALFFSPRSAGEFVRLVEEEGLCHCLHRVEALCLSSMVQRVLRPQDWKVIRTARVPDTDALLELLSHGR